jgi:hypothetical protein
MPSPFYSFKILLLIEVHLMLCLLFEIVLVTLAPICTFARSVLGESHLKSSRAGVKAMLGAKLLMAAVYWGTILAVLEQAPFHSYFVIVTSLCVVAL